MTTQLIALAAVIAFVLIVALAQGIGQSVGHGTVEWLVR